jgi:O-antigen/teichoic acid export membrane protein
LLRISFSVFLSICALIAIGIYTPASPKLEVLLLGLAAMVLSSFVETSETLFTGVERFRASATMQVIGRSVYLLFGFIALGLGFSVVAVMFAYVASIAVESSIRMVYLLRNVTTLTWRIKGREVITVLWGMAPFAITAVASMIYFRIDAFILDLVKGDEAVGIYGAAYSFYSFFVWVPIVLSRALLPGMTEQYHHDPGGAEGTCWFWYRIGAVAAIPVIFISTVVAGPLIRNLMPSPYVDSIPVLQILLWSIPPMMMTSVGFIILTVADKEVLGAHSTIATAVIIVIMDLILIPRYSGVGAAVAVVATTVIWSGQMHWLLSRYVLTSEHGVIRTFTMPILSGLIMGAVGLALWPLGTVMSLIGGLAAYGVTASLIRVVENKKRVVPTP